MENFPILAKLENEKVFSITREGDGFRFVEGCDNYFSIVLSVEETRTLGMELIALADISTPKASYISILPELIDRLGKDALRNLDLEESANRAGCLGGSWPIGMTARETLALLQLIKEARAL